MKLTKSIQILLFALMASACTHTVRTSSVQMLRHPEKVSRDTQPLSVMKRQIANAADAGDGDTIARGLRQRMAADPLDLKTRMDLARHYEEIGFPELAAGLAVLGSATAIALARHTRRVPDSRSRSNHIGNTGRFAH